MKSAITIISLVIFFFATTPLSAKDKAPPSTEKATIYIVRPSIIGVTINFRYFIDDQYIGKSKQGKYLKIQVDPGEHIIWAKAENFSFLDVNVKAGETYVINAVPAMGLIYSSVILEPVSNTDDRFLKRIKKYIAKKKQWEYKAIDSKKEQNKVAKWIRKSKKKYQKRKEKGEVNSLYQAIEEEKICTCTKEGTLAPFSGK